MTVGESLFGFKILEATDIKEASGRLYLMRHDSGARLAFLEREDENKTFAIAFPTPPEDDTGVFHIIEHSTLCGSKKFPVKEPFVELLKGSLNTFLNALTYEDRTVYPVSSRCGKDFYNLTEVYLDAVFCPLMRENPFIFSQEGWRYEYNEEEKALSYNGVVYNEMKGAYSSPDELLYSELSRILFEGTSYGRDSGGNPRHIPELTYEKFCALHDKYYRPSNAYIYLDGSVDLSSILPLIASYLDGYEKYPETVISADFKTGKRCSTVYYEVNESEDGRDGARLLIGYPFSDYSKTAERLLSSVIVSHLSASNDSPIPKALLDSGLCEDVIVGVNHSKVHTLTVEIKGFAPENKDKLIEIYETAIKKECAGMDRRSLHANLNRSEFKLRERDFGSFPIGVANALSVFEAWCYGGNCATGLVFEEDIATVRQGIDSGMAESLLKKMTVENETRAEVLMLPDPALGEKREKALKETLRKKLNSLTEKELEEIKERQKEFTLWQESEDSEEALAALPTLALSDVTPGGERQRSEIEESRGATLLRQKVASGGISYLSLFLKADDLSEEELPLLSVLSMALTNLNTENYTVSELKSEIKSALGAFSFSTSVVSNSKKGVTYPALRLNASVLPSGREKLTSLIREVLTKTVYEDRSAIKKLLTQAVTELEDSFASNGEAAAMSRLEAMSTVAGRMNELMRGYEFYLKAKKYLKELSEDPDGFLSRLKELTDRLSRANRAIISIASDRESDLCEKILEIFPVGEPYTPAKINMLPKKREAITIPSEVGYATFGGIIPEARELLGALRVARSVLSYEHLWNAIRVKGGAYGAGFISRRDTGIYFYSYRDPSPESSVKAFKSCSDYLRAIAESGRDLTKFIIGAYGEYDTLKTPKTEALAQTADALTDWTAEDERKLREGLLSTDKNALLAVASILDKLSASGTLCVAAPQRDLDSFEERFESTIKLS